MGLPPKWSLSSWGSPDYILGACTGSCGPASRSAQGLPRHGAGEPERERAGGEVWDLLALHRMQRRFIVPHTLLRDVTGLLWLQVIDEVLVQSVALGRLTRNARLSAAKRAHVTVSNCGSAWRLAVMLSLQSQTTTPPQEFLPGEELCSMGEVQDCLLVVMSGEVEVTQGAHSNRPTPIPSQPSSKLFSHAHSSAAEAGGRGAGARASSSSTSAESSIAGELRLGGPHRGSAQQHLASTKSTALVSPLSAVDLDPLPRSLEPGRQPAHPALAAIQRTMAAGSSGSGHSQPQPHGSSTWGSAASRGDLGAQRSQYAAGSSSGGGSGSTLLHRGDTLGALDLQWLSKQSQASARTRSAAQAGPPGSHLTSRAVLATRAELASQQQQRQGSQGFLDVEEGSPATKAQNALQSQLRRLSALGDGGDAGGAQSDSDDDGSEGLGLRWSCSAVAVTRVECVAIGMRQLCEVLASEVSPPGRVRTVPLWKFAHPTSTGAARPCYGTFPLHHPGWLAT